MTSFYSDEELRKIGFKKIGVNVLLSRKACIYGAERISIGNNVRIDDFCFISGTIEIGNYVHIAVGVYLYGGQTGIVLRDFVGISSRTCVLSESDDFTGESLTNPTISDELKNIVRGQVILEKHSIVGTGCTILPRVVVGEGAAVGSMSLINKSLEPWGVYVGIPCKKIRDRKKDLLEKEKVLLGKG